jgi:hypothetical protein
MPRTVRVAPAGVIFHVLNRANARSRNFDKDLDLVVIGKRRADNEGARGVALVSAKGTSFWERKLDDSYGQAARVAIDDARA